MTIKSKKREAQEFLQGLVEANKTLQKPLWGSIRVISVDDSRLQVINLVSLCDALEQPYLRDNWSGNKTCDSNYDIVYFEYEGITFFELVDKEGENENEGE